MKINQKLKIEDFKNTHNNLLKGPKAFFETKEAQREFFVSVKTRLGIGSRNLSKIIGMQSRGALENYTSTRTAPPVAIVRKLEELSGIKADYTIVKGLIKRKKRQLTPLTQENANKILRRFGNDYKLIIKLIKEGLTIIKIERILRDRGHTFDSSPVARAIGTIRTNLRIKFTNSINIKNHVVFSGYVRNIKGSSSINFHLVSFIEYILKKKPRVGFIIKEDKSLVKLVPLSKIGRKLSFRTGKVIYFLLPLHLNLKNKSNIKIAILPSDFGLDYLSFITDKDGKKLAKVALKRGIQISPIRSTYVNCFGDIVFIIKGKQHIIEITKAEARNISKFKLGQLLIQTIENPNSKHVLICRYCLFSKNSLKALKYLDVKLIESDFSKDWPETALKEILKLQNDLQRC